ncbi:Repressor ROX1 [Hypsizygus marmoreus]|uniref:Repressor ROX1 n=1 Tax=Hypsizygus marmoreus TaxID=39966 RepID=A0A369JNI2_HYPMA|nr:Repressor ROX1 [Hypsizygus marmoreus]
MQHNVPMKDEEAHELQFPVMYTLPPYLNTSELQNSDFGNWSLSSAPDSKFTPAPIPPHEFLPLSGPLHGAEQQSLCFSHPENSFSNPTNPPTYPQFQNSYHFPSTSQGLPPPSPRTHIPRPPNAFMLYRSNLLKNGTIPPNVERRQQHLSRVAGECWNLLPPEEKAKWQDQAAKVLLEHQQRNPDYKFTPAPRGSRRAKAKGRADNGVEQVEGEDRIRQIREEYTKIAGPAVPPTRRRRAKTQNRDLKKESDTEKSPIQPQPVQSPPPSIPPSPSFSSPGHESNEMPPLPPYFPQYSFPHIAAPPRRPSTSLGFSTPSQDNDRVGLNLARPSSTATSETGLTTFLKELDITPTASTFGLISMPPKSPSPVPVSFPNPEMHLPDALRDSVPFTALDLSFHPSAPSGDGSAQMPQNNPESFLGALYGDKFDFMMNSTPNQPFFDDTYIYDTFGASTSHQMQGAWNLGNSSLTDALNPYTL